MKTIPSHWLVGKGAWRRYRWKLGLSKYPRRALHLSGSDAMFGGVHFFGLPILAPWDFILVFSAKFGVYGPKLL